MEGAEGDRCGVAREGDDVVGTRWGSGSGGLAGEASRELDGSDNGGPEGD
jgi:hypothetical protein